MLVKTIVGIAGASYVPTVQAALPRLLGAAAPPGTSASDNRRKCLKVLTIRSFLCSLHFCWLESVNPLPSIGSAVVA